MVAADSSGDSEVPFYENTKMLEKAWQSHLLQYALSYCIAYRNFAPLAPGMAVLDGDDRAKTLFHGQLTACCFALVSDSLVVAAQAEQLLPLLDTRPALHQVCAGALERTWAVLPPITGDRYIDFVLGAAAENPRWRQAKDLRGTLPDILDLEGQIFSPSPFIIQTQLLNGHLKMFLTQLVVMAHAEDTYPKQDFLYTRQAILKAPLSALPANAGDVWKAAEVMELCFHLSMLVDPLIRHNGQRMRARVDSLHQSLLGKPFFEGGPSGERLETPRAMQSLMRIAELSRPLTPNQVRL